MLFDRIGSFLLCIAAASAARTAIAQQPGAPAPQEFPARAVELGAPAARYSLADIGAVVATDTVEVSCDPAYHRPLTFTGFRLGEVVKAFFDPAVGDTLIFTAADGYRAFLPLNAASDPRALLAFSNTPDGTSWLPAPPEVTGDPGPLYLVWEGTSICDSSLAYAWPYQVVSISIAPRDVVLKAIEPDPARDSAAAVEGFAVFREYCISCHRIKGVGGTLGPELVATNGVTDYLPPETLRAFVFDAPSFNPKTKMPAFKDKIGPDTYEKLVTYLEWAGAR